MPYIQKNQTTVYYLEGRKYRKMHSRYSITIPSNIMKFLGWKKGDELEFKLENGKVVLRRKG
jgi:AbrB family looped-hinge helix DNA binding protein